MAAQKVIVFGPTGGVGSATARTAHDLGATVILAMRDTKKSIPGFDSANTDNVKLERVQADLQDPQTVSDAVSSTGAKRAFMYLAHRSPDNMKSTIQALKSAGIELLVFLSSFTIQVAPEEVKASEVIPYIHAQVEINLREVFGPDGYVAVRPGSFASNTFQYKDGLKSGAVKVLGPDRTVDNIVPDDIGRVCGTVLVKGVIEKGNKPMYLYGPELMTNTDCVKTLAKVLGKDPKIEAMEADEAKKVFIERGWPAPLADYMIRRSKMDSEGTTVAGYSVSKEELSNVERYTGRKATTFEEWAEKNKQVFLS
jgi:uncharacterized protein YbjT (DUF2867 family)